MPSPFPGMDPYLEDRRVWPGFHTWFLTVVAERLNEQLADDYVVSVEERVYLIGPDDAGWSSIVPDVLIGGEPGTRGPVVPNAREDDALRRIGVAVPTLTFDAERFEVRERCLRIEKARPAELLTVIELLSPSNKRSGSAGRRAYWGKREELLASPVSLVEIDLLLGGEAFIATGQSDPGQYSVLVSRRVSEGDRPRRTNQVWRFPWRATLPRIPIPLDAAVPLIPLDLADVFRLTYDRGRFEKQVDYTVELSDLLPPDDVHWALEQAHRAS